MSGRAWTEKDRRRLIELYPARSTKHIAQVLERSMTSVYGMANKLGLVKSDEYWQSDECGWPRPGKSPEWLKPTQFPKGKVPFNKGLRRPGYHVGRMRETQFKKGERSGIAATNWKPIGTIMPDFDGYLRIKVRDAVHGKEPTGFGNVRVWPLYSRYLWEQHHGPIPPKHIVYFKDGNRANCVIDNLGLMSLADNARRNSMWATLPRELAEGGIL